MEKGKKSNSSKPSAVFKTGAVALAFIIIGYQAALFVHRASVLRIEANRDRPDTVFVVMPAFGGGGVDGGLAGDEGAWSGAGGGGQSGSAGGVGGGLAGDEGAWSGSGGGGRSGSAGGAGGAFGGGADGAGGGGQSLGAVAGEVVRRSDSHHSNVAQAVREQTRRVETFRFNPNTVSVEDLIRLGFSRKQAESIDNYRQKGGKFRRKSDLAKSFVVADSVYKRLENSIVIPKTDINKADSAAFDDLPGIGPYFAAKMVSYRESLGGYSCIEQLLDIYHFDEEKLEGLRDFVTCSQPAPFRLWTLPADSLRLHPYIGNWKVAKAIVLYRENNAASACTIDGLLTSGVISDEIARKLRLCNIAPLE